MNSTIDLPIETKRLVIRRFIDSDLELFLAFMLDERSTKYLMFDEEQKTKSGATNLFNIVRNSYDTKQPVYSFAIAEKQSDRYVGSCGFSPYDRDIWEIYYSINGDRENRGFATEAIQAMVLHLSQQGEIRAYCHPQNKAAHKVALKSGFIELGLAKHQHFDREGYLFIYQDKTK